MLDDKRWFEAHAVGHPMKTLAQPVRMTGPAADFIPRTYIECTAGKEGAPIPEYVERARARDGWNYGQLATCYWPMITMPARLVDLFLECAG